MVLGLTFTGSFDLTAIGTLALAVVTGVSLVFAWHSLRQTQQQINLGQEQLRQTQHEIELSRREVEEAHRPVVVPVLISRDPAATSVSRSRYTLPSAPCLVAPGVLAVPLKNIGAGPALRVEASIRRLSDDGTPLTGPIEPQTPGTLCGIGVSEIASIEIFAHAFEERWQFNVTVTYEDVAGKRWQTDARWNSSERRYTDLHITTPRHT